LISLQGRLVLKPPVNGFSEITKERKIEKAPGGAHALSMSKIPPGTKKRMARWFEASRAKVEHAMQMNSKKHLTVDASKKQPRRMHAFKIPHRGMKCQEKSLLHFAGI
jgi:hypothetical protein